MPANLPPQYYELEREFNKETDLNEKLRLAKELLVMMPKHKGTDKLQAEMKSKISKLKAQIEGGVKKTAAHHVDPFSHIDKEGAAQIILIGPPNSGKSSIVASCTHAKPLIADYPYSTLEPLTGMMEYETTQIQLIDTPPISDIQMATYLPNLIRQADIVILVYDLTDTECENGVKTITRLLQEKNIALSPESSSDSNDARYLYKKTIIAATKYEDPKDEIALENLKKSYSGFDIIALSILDDELLANFKKEVFKTLNIIRVFTKRIGHEADFSDPIVLPIGSTVGDAAFHLHKDFAHKLQFAKIWGKGKFEGQHVKGSFVLSDGDIVEFHI